MASHGREAHCCRFGRVTSGRPYAQGGWLRLCPRHTSPVSSVVRGKATIWGPPVRASSRRGSRADEVGASCHRGEARARGGGSWRQSRSRARRANLHGHSPHRSRSQRGNLHVLANRPRTIRKLAPRSPPMRPGCLPLRVSSRPKPNFRSRNARLRLSDLVDRLRGAGRPRRIGEQPYPRESDQTPKRLGACRRRRRWGSSASRQASRSRPSPPNLG